MQVATIEFARHVCGLGGANSTEFDPDTPHPVIALIDEWKDRTGRIEARRRLRPGRHDAPGRAEVPGRAAARWPTRSTATWSPSATATATRSTTSTCRNWRGRARCSARTPPEKLTEIVELPSGHPWFVGVQFHPEFKSTPWDGHPLFNAFVKAALATASSASRALNRPRWRRAAA